MKPQILGIYREVEFSPGKVAADRAIMDTVLAHLGAAGAATFAIDAATFATTTVSSDTRLILAMCQGSAALSALAAAERSGSIAVNSALAIRNCYRDLLGPGLINARVPTPEGAVITTVEPIDLKPLRTLDLAGSMYVKRGDLHALGPEDVQRVTGSAELTATLHAFGRRGIRLAYVQQEVVGTVIKFYGVGAGEYFATLSPEGASAPSEGLRRDLARAASSAAAALGLEVWGGDAIVADNRFAIVDLNDWPSFERVREEAALAIARRVQLRLRSQSA